MTEKPPFRAIVVGAGLLGLTAAHMLAKTDMDFVVLEQHADLLPEIGSLLSLSPPTFRVLDQLGVLEAVEPVLTRVASAVFMAAADARVFRKEDIGRLVETNHGHGMSIVHRPDYVKALYDSLPEEAKARIHVRKRVVRIDVADDGVAVHCADGTVERGSIVIGADGVHSRTRQTMQSLAKGQPVDTEQPSPFVTTYRMLFGNLRALPDLPAGTNFECAGNGVSTQIMTGATQAWFGLYEKLATPTSKRLRWTEDDKKEVLEKWGKLYMAPGYTVEDAYRRRSGDLGLINLEEGLLDTWSWKRIVLVGDADQRMEDTPAIVAMSERRARMCAWLGVKDWFMATVVAPLFPLGEYSINNILGPIISRTPVLDWLDEKRLPARAMPYVHHPRAETKEQGVYNRPAAAAGSRLPLLTGTLVVAALATVGFRFYRRV
ncbi:hypothetical protein CHU98_g10205 [Xylaria longipes]|nr:hypothetical protein CHU98_g10205 [Xylaria longipes]